MRGTGAGSEGVEPPAVGVGDRGATAGSSPKGNARMTLCAWWGEALKIRREASELPALDGPADVGKLPSSRLGLVIEALAGCARERADARQGPTLERSFGGADACHRDGDSAP